MRAVRLAAAGVAAIVAVSYFLIALGVVTVVSTPPQPGDAVIPGAAGLAFTILAVLLVVTERRIISALGAAMSLLTIIGYFVVAPHRAPSFEAWGIFIKVAQSALVLALGYLALNPSRGETQRRQLT